MASKKKLLQAAAGSAGGAGLDVEEVFSTYLYDGNGSAQTITNGIDLSGEGGLVWNKTRNVAFGHNLFDTERGFGTTYAYRISSTATNAQSELVDGLSSFNSNGFSVGNSSIVNGSSYNYASWTFRKAKKFFDVVTYTGTGVARTVSHNLGSEVGSIFIKRTDTTQNWAVYHRGANGGTNPEDYYFRLNQDIPQVNDTNQFNSTPPTSTEFYLGTDIDTNASGSTYVAYLFAHNDGDGEFGPDGDADIIKCGSYTEGSFAQEINLGFEPQFMLMKITSTSGDWFLFDVMSGFDYSNLKYLRPNSSSAESIFGSAYVRPTPTGFIAPSGFFGSGQTVMYIAIRRGPLAAPESATDVFAIDTQSQSSAPFAISNFPVDFAIRKDVDGSTTDGFTRLLQGKGLALNSDAAEGSDSVAQFDYQNGYLDGTTQDTTRYNFMWKRAPSWFDCLCYTGNGLAGHTVNHNLTVPPEMIWVKPRETGLSSSDWWVFHKDLSTPSDDSLVLNSNGAENTGNGALLWNSTMPTSSVFSLGSYNGINQSGRDFIAYLFATVAGVSKVGSYTGDATDGRQIDCGFTSGARFVLIKCSNSTGNWMVFDTTRGIVAGNDPFLKLNATGAETTTDDKLDPYSGGFIVNFSGASINNNGQTYIFYAIA